MAELEKQLMRVEGDKIIIDQSLLPFHRKWTLEVSRFDHKRPADLKFTLETNEGVIKDIPPFR